jgi:hypothetical protein
VVNRVCSDGQLLQRRYARTPLEDLFREGHISARPLPGTNGDTFQLCWQLKTTDTTGMPDISFRLIGEVRHSQEPQENHPDQRIECARVSRKSLSKWFVDKKYPSWMTATIDGLPNRAQVWAILDPEETVQETGEESQRSLGSPFRSSRGFLFDFIRVHNENNIDCVEQLREGSDLPG